MATGIFSTPQAQRHKSFSSAGYSEDRGKKAKLAGLGRSHTIAEEPSAASSPASVSLRTISPLERFKVAKDQVSTLFDNIRGLLEESGENLLTLASEDEALSSSDNLRNLRAEFDTERTRMRNIAEKVRSNQMKVAFFGRTSNGKSSTINALLRDRVLPSGIGHTTSCFCCVEGTDEEKGFLELPGSRERKSIESVQQLAHAVHNDKLESSAAVKVFWPRDRCPLLKNDVVLVDSPGTDISSDLDSCIGEHCTDADVFVLVANAESTLMQTEKNFFHKVAQMSSRPNIFILNNRWDASACEDKELINEVREQHMTFNVGFLADELRVVDRVEARKRIFFVSAKEALQIRMQSRGQASGGGLQDGHKGRFVEFQQFEKVLEECLSSHAIRTKFSEPALSGMQVAARLQDSLTTFQQHVEQLRIDCEDKSRTAWEDHVVLRRVGKERLQQWAEQIQAMRQHARDQVANAVSDEIHRLWNTVNEHKSEAGFNESDLKLYQQELCTHMSSGMGEHLVASCSSDLSTICTRVQQDMLDEFNSLMPSSLPPPARTSITWPHFRISDDIDLVDICSDFRADLQFRFRWRLPVVYQWLLGCLGCRGSQNFTMSHVSDMMRRSASVDGRSTSLESGQLSPVVSAAPSVEAVSSVLQVAVSAVGQTPVLLSVGALAVKMVGGRVLLGGLALFGVVYGYERLCWTTRAKERAYKEQLVEHVTKKLEIMVGFMSNSSSHQVEQHLESFKEDLNSEMSKAQSCLNEQQSTYRARAEQLDRLENNVKKVVNTAQFASSGFESFLNELELTGESGAGLTSRASFPIVNGVGIQSENGDVAG